MPSVPNNILRNLPFCSLASFLIVSLTPLNSKLESSRGLIILIMSFVSSFDITSVVLPDTKIFYVFLHLSAGDATAINPKGIKILSANGLITDSFSNPHFNLSSCELDSFTFKLVYCVILY